MCETTMVLGTDAIRGVRQHGLPYYDALIWTAARPNSVPVALSEDFDSGATLGSVQLLNPLDPAFDLAMLD